MVLRLGVVVGIKVQVHKGALNLRERFKLVLQRLAHVVRLPQRLAACACADESTAHAVSE